MLSMVAMATCLYRGSFGVLGSKTGSYHVEPLDRDNDAVSIVIGCEDVCI